MKLALSDERSSLAIDRDAFKVKVTAERENTVLEVELTLVEALAAAKALEEEAAWLRR